MRALSWVLLPALPMLWLACAGLSGEVRRVIVVAHRGGAGIAPENTLAALRKAIRLGADYVEVDVRTTADGRLVILHDRTVDRTTDGTGEVARLNYADVARLDAGNPAFGCKREPIPLFEDVVRLCRGRAGLYIDHKDASVAAVIEGLDRMRFGPRVVVYGSPDRLSEYRTLKPTLPIMPRHPHNLEEMARLFEKLRPETLDGHMREWTREHVEAAHRHGATVWMDVMGEADNERGWHQAVELGADALQTDYPDRLIAFLRRRGLR